ncbi:MAG: hypothetical protein L6Q71_11930 [Planctomycetes bacterium]|nr:hypothetical protein [Planctomycetota bacterium]
MKPDHYTVVDLKTAKKPSSRLRRVFKKLPPSVIKTRNKAALVLSAIPLFFGATLMALSFFTGHDAFRKEGGDLLDGLGWIVLFIGIPSAIICCLTSLVVAGNWEGWLIVLGLLILNALFYASIILSL